ncbi:MAG TPA: 5-(carboxyamino)imidazole ribonucleotide mutase, partial [Bacillota bacterium]
MPALVAIVMGSDSDLPVMTKAAEVLEEFAVDYSMHILSAHRTPDEALALARNAQAEGYKVLIAGAGMAAHLPGVLAAQTTLPVIGVPLASPTTGGVDALWSIVQMPPGVPVATVAINGAKNAAYL